MVQPSYTTARLAAEYVLNDNWTLFGRIENLFNEQYEDPAGFLRPGFGIFGGVRLDVGGLGASGQQPMLTKTYEAPEPTNSLSDAFLISRNDLA
jgi:TonB dependent receptor